MGWRDELRGPVVFLVMLSNALMFQYVPMWVMPLVTPSFCLPLVTDCHCCGLKRKHINAPRYCYDVTHQSYIVCLFFLSCQIKNKKNKSLQLMWVVDFAKIDLGQPVLRELQCMFMKRNIFSRSFFGFLNLNLFEMCNCL